MAINEVILPKTGINMEDVYLLEWLAEEGSEVKVGAPLFRMETEKVEMDIESDDAGWLHQVIAPSDTGHPIGTVIGYLASTQQEYAQLLAGGTEQ